MKNIEKIRSLLQQAFQSIPDDFALSEVRHHIRSALTKIAKMENKKSKPEEVKTPTWNELIKDGMKTIVNSNTPGRTLDIIKQMIAKEQQKLSSIDKPTDTEILNENI